MYRRTDCKDSGRTKLGKKVRDVARGYGTSENTFNIWKRKYADMTSKEITRLKQLEQENENLKRLVANLSLDNMAQKEIIKKFCDPE
ncbi:hypothetical protein EXM22_02850 [Oceanispirochaeta crateris]|uniref:Transposase n=1 Tax=Oceanispirochaeta crateris TaxID=2518645 RepID=A0A5C1QP15_9SPIO|nr:hypothetical protein EXM22_02850 [Oceanispirochaeta crateris]